MGSPASSFRLEPAAGLATGVDTHRRAPYSRRSIVGKVGGEWKILNQTYNLAAHRRTRRGRVHALVKRSGDASITQLYRIFGTYGFSPANGARGVGASILDPLPAKARWSYPDVRESTLAIVCEAAQFLVNSGPSRHRRSMTSAIGSIEIFRVSVSRGP